MPKARKHLISLDATPYYHCMSRCVRQAFLCGEDPVTGHNFEHRRQWIEDRILLLGEVMCIDVCAYAVMSNHLHVVLRANHQEAECLDDVSVCLRWHQLYSGTELSKKLVNDDILQTHEQALVDALVSTWRERLFDISWFMRALNEPIARLANAEDKCSGRFWESRFKSQALLDEKALLSCMTYVDLNPIRAKMALTPKDSQHTSIKRRSDCYKSAKSNGLTHDKDETPLGLAPLIATAYTKNNNAENRNNIVPLPINLKDYLELVDWTGRVIREDKRGSISSDTPPILERLNMGRHQWRHLTTQFESRFKHLVGSVAAITDAAETFCLKRRHGIGAAEILFG